MSKTFKLGTILNTATGKPRDLHIDPVDLNRKDTEWDAIQCVVKPRADVAGVCESLTHFCIQDATFSKEVLESNTPIGNKLKALAALSPSIITRYDADSQLKSAAELLQILSYKKGIAEKPSYDARWRLGIDQTYVDLVSCQDANRVKDVLAMPGFKEFTKVAPPSGNTFTHIFKDLSSKFGTKPLDPQVSKNLLKVAELNPKAYNAEAKVYSTLSLPVVRELTR